MGDEDCACEAKAWSSRAVVEKPEHAVRGTNVQWDINSQGRYDCPI